MKIVYWEPNGSRYRVGVAIVDDQPGRVVFCFVYGDHPMTASVANRREPHAFDHFVKHWDSIGLAGNVIDVWTGFMALRHVLGYATTWEELPEETRREATRMFADGAFLSTPQRELASYDRHWREQLQPLIEALAH